MARSRRLRTSRLASSTSFSAACLSRRGASVPWQYGCPDESCGQWRLKLSPGAMVTVSAVAMEGCWAGGCCFGHTFGYFTSREGACWRGCTSADGACCTGMNGEPLLGLPLSGPVKVMPANPAVASSSETTSCRMHRSYAANEKARLVCASELQLAHPFLLQNFRFSQPVEAAVAMDKGVQI
eukprot:1156791-Pelagomonas_calceolata.AAC.2